MADPADIEACPAERLTQALQQVGQDTGAGLAQVEALLADYPRDPQLHFLRGSLLAGLQRHGEAAEAMGRAVEIAPQFTVARFQLGLLHLTSGDAAAAEAVWGPLQDLPPEHPLFLFVEGLRCLARDEFAASVDLLQRGIAHNTENAAINRDMQMVIDAVSASHLPDGADAAATSPAHLLLQQYRAKPTRH